ncbi:unnamed protein product [Lactuca virosa]|uniref:phosphoribosylaminoimidazole carboxylase n=1 Tax=Lactuca virosa TaxID=75947 RepID=A0AAU9MV83_9ASTR|nr:unnamed protein product [Lactuca virosa]
MGSRSYDKVADIYDQLMLQGIFTLMICEISTKCWKGFVRIAKRCLLSHPKERPTMVEVVFCLESTLNIQDKINSSLQPMMIQSFGKVSRGRVENNTFISTNPDVGIRKHKEEGFQRHTTSLGQKMNMLLNGIRWFAKELGKLDFNMEFNTNEGEDDTTGGMVAALTPLPVIGVPVRASALDGLDSLLSIVQGSAGETKLEKEKVGDVKGMMALKEITMIQMLNPLKRLRMLPRKKVNPM